MLVLTRNESESVIIDVPPSDTPTRIEVVAFDVKHKRVKLGFNADLKVTIWRPESNYGGSINGKS